MAYSYRWQYCDMDFLRHCLKKYSLLLEKIPSAILTEETTGTQMFVTEFLSDCIKRCDDGFDDYTMTALLPEGAATVTLQENRDTVRRLSTRYHGEYAALLPEMAAYYFSKAGRQQRRDTEQALGKRCFAFFDYAYNRMLEAQFLRHDFRWVGGEIPSVNHLKTLSDAADLTEALGQFRREEYDRRKEHDFSHAKLCTFLETRFGMLYFENRFAAYLLQPVSGGFSADDGSTESWLLWRCSRLLGGIALTAERKVCRLFGTDENEQQQVLAAYFCFCRQKGIPFSGEMQLCQPEYPEPLGKDFLPWKWESGKVTPQLLQTIADQLRQCAPEQAADWCWLLGTRLVFTVLPLAKEALAALPQLERDAFFVQAEQFLRETATALGDQPQPLTEPNFEKLTAQYGKLLLVDFPFPERCSCFPAMEVGVRQGQGGSPFPEIGKQLTASRKPHRRPLKGFPAMEVGVRQGHATAAASHSRPTAAMCPGTRHRLVLAAGNTAGIHRAAPGKRGIGSTAPAGTGCPFRTGGTVPAKNGSCFR